jgi:hypothetical protein
VKCFMRSRMTTSQRLIRGEVEPIDAIADPSDGMAGVSDAVGDIAGVSAFILYDQITHFRCVSVSMRFLPQGRVPHAKERRRSN